MDHSGSRDWDWVCNGESNPRELAVVVHSRRWRDRNDPLRGGQRPIQGWAGEPVNPNTTNNQDEELRRLARYAQKQGSSNSCAG